MRLAFVSQPGSTATLPVQNGAIQIWIYEVARRLAERHEVTVYTSAQPGQPTSERYQGVTYHRIPLGWDAYSSRVYRGMDRMGIGPRTKPFYGRSRWYPAFARQVAAALRKEAVGCLHLMNFAQMLPVLRHQVPHATLVLHMHAEWLTQWDPKMVAGYLAHVDGVLGCSPFIVDAVRQRFPHLAERIQSIPNGVDVDHFSPSQISSSEPTILFIGRLSPEKGLHVLMSALPRVFEAVPNVRVQLIGAEKKAAPDFIDPGREDPDVQALGPLYRGSYVAYLKGMIPEKMKDRVAFEGAISHEELPAYLRKATVLVNPSIRETFGMSLIEAMASGCPVIASKIGGMKDLVSDGETGLLITRNDADALAEALISLLNNPDQRAKMGGAGRKRVETAYTWNAIVKDLEAYYTKISRS